MFQIIKKVSLFLIFIVLGCQQPADKLQKKQSLSINICFEPESLDPRKGRTLTDMALMRMFFEGLTRIFPDHKPHLALAKDMEVSEDGKKYVFHLKNTVWSNGDPLTSNDFEYSWKQALSPQFPSAMSYQLFVIKGAKLAKEGRLSLDQTGIRTPDSETLEIELERPCPYFLDLLSLPIFFPVNKKIDIEKSSWAEKVETFIGNGPFLFSKWDHLDRIETIKNLNYWDQETVKLDSLSLMMISPDTELSMFEMGELDWAGSPFSTIPSDSINKLKQEGRLKIQPLLGTAILRVNISDPLKETSQRAFRKALAYSINRSQMVLHVLQGDQIPATCFVPSQMKSQEVVFFNDHDLDKARLYMNEAGEMLKDSKMEPTIVLSYPSLGSGERNQILAQTLQMEWAENLGRNVSLQAIEPKVYFFLLKKGTYQLALGNWVADVNDPMNFLEVFKYKENGVNNTFWENKEYTALLDRADLCQNHEEREKLLIEAEKILLEEMPIIPLYQLTMNYIQSEKCKNIFLSPLGYIDFKWASIEL